jgi:hypothetical protein
MAGVVLSASRTPTNSWSSGCTGSGFGGVGELTAYVCEIGLAGAKEAVYKLV